LKGHSLSRAGPPRETDTLIGTNWNQSKWCDCNQENKV